MESNYMFYSQKRIFAYKLGNFSYGQGRSSLPGTLVCPPSLEKRGARAPPPPNYMPERGGMCKAVSESMFVYTVYVCVYCI